MSSRAQLRLVIDHVLRDKHTSEELAQALAAAEERRNRIWVGPISAVVPMDVMADICFR